MEQKLFLLLCLTGVLPAALSVLQSVPHFYYLIQTPKTWSDAQTYCRETYTDLATVTSTDDWMRFNKEAKKYYFTSLAWVGLYNDISSWRWSYQDTPLVFTKWFITEPNNYGGHEACAAVDIYGNWWDLNCLDQKPFLCYNASSTGSDRFIIITSLMKSFFDAQAYCREHYTDLATSSNIQENTLLTALVQGQWSAWFGLFRDTWKWSDQSNASAINWGLGHPDNFWGQEKCGFYYNGQMDDDVCTNARPFFCHIIPPVQKRRIVKLLVKSDQRIFDAAVRSSILKRIEQKLQEQGLMENITLTWRTQTDGNVFYKMKTLNTTTKVCGH